VILQQSWSHDIGPSYRRASPVHRVLCEWQNGARGLKQAVHWVYSPGCWRFIEWPVSLHCWCVLSPDVLSPAQQRMRLTAIYRGTLLLKAGMHLRTLPAQLQQPLLGCWRQAAGASCMGTPFRQHMAVIRPASGFPGRRCLPGLCALCFPSLACSPCSLPLLGLTALPGL
jgi:hypothetical protein